MSMMRVEITAAKATMVALVTALCLSACDNGPSAVQTRDRTTVEAPGEARLMAATGADAGETLAGPVEKTVLTANRRETVDAKVARLYERNGADFGARSPEQFLEKLEAFTKTPPAGVETATRPNGDTLYYQASTNTFAVVSRDGVPRTMFKPDDGVAYWAKQKERAPTFGRRRTASASGSASGEGR